MSNRLHIQGEYPADWNQIGDRVREEAGHRCIRCKHPYRTGQHGKGEWSPCDERCKHGGPLWTLYNGVYAPIGDDWTAAGAVRGFALSGRNEIVCAQWRILTVHHLNGNKADCFWGNLLAVCQRCHLQIQSRVVPDIPYFLEHSTWFKPYAAAHYARKYLGETLTREEVMARLDDLLLLERLA